MKLYRSLALTFSVTGFYLIKKLSTPEFISSSGQTQNQSPKYFKTAKNLLTQSIYSQKLIHPSSFLSILAKTFHKNSTLILATSKTLKEFLKTITNSSLLMNFLEIPLFLLYLERPSSATKQIKIIANGSKSIVLSVNFKRPFNKKKISAYESSPKIDTTRLLSSLSLTDKVLPLA